jgi:hypothetical protein
VTPPPPTPDQPKKRSESRRRRSMLALRLLPEEHAKLRAEADRHNMTVSEYARSRVLAST